MTNEGVVHGTTSPPAMSDVAKWVQNAMLEMKGRGDIIRNAWKRHDYEWFVDNTSATATATATVNNDGAPRELFKLGSINSIKAIPLVLIKQASLRRVAGLWIVTENTGDLRKRPVVSWSVPHHVARDKANAAAIDPIRHPNCCDRRLLFPLNHQLNLTEAHHNVLLQHLAANLMLLARAALATHLRPYDLDNNTTRMDGLAKQKGHGRHSGRGNKDGGGGFFSAGACAIALSAVKRGGTGAGASAGAAAWAR